MTYGPKFPLKDSCRTHGISSRFPIQDIQVSRKTASWQQAVTRDSKNDFIVSVMIDYHDHAGRESILKQAIKLE